MTLALLFSLLAAISAITLAFIRAPLWSWAGMAALLLLAHSLWGGPSTPALVLWWLLFVAIFGLLAILPLRRRLFSQPMLALYRRLAPPISDTERAAIEAGTTSWDAELFSGKPDWAKLLTMPAAKVSAEEQAFLDGPTAKLCAMLDDWDITYKRRDLPPKAWKFIKEQGFFGMIIPKQFGGLGFSAMAHSAVIAKIASKSLTAAVTVMVPNSLGPAELLLRYGSEGQKAYYLPRLARGEDIPCFALTSPHAGSDAAAMIDSGVICKGTYDGRQDVLGIRLNWEKRYITLAPVATVLGLAFKLYDPDKLLGGRENLGITLALIPTSTPGVEVGQRHLPLDQAFLNGPTKGKDVFVPLDQIIGGRDYIGQGWRMLMECLADGRAISLPALAAGGCKLAARGAGAYARIRKQFKLPIGRFEGVAEALARIGGNTYAVDAARRLAASIVDQGGKPSVVSAMVKYHCTERLRAVTNDAMDVFGGTAICLGPRNLLGRVYQSIPISITVEGANILTRSLIIFGQGVIRCHPHLLSEMRAAGLDDGARALKEFDRAFFGHLGFVISNKVRAFLLALSQGRLARRPLAGHAGRYAQQVERFSAALAVTADVSLFVLGGTIKRKESLSARLGDVLSQLYFASAAIKHFQDQGSPDEDLPLLHWACQDALYRAQEQLIAFLHNFPNPLIAAGLRLLLLPGGRPFKAPSDRLIREVVPLLLESSGARERLTDGIFIGSGVDDPLGRIELALTKVTAAAAAEERLRAALKKERLAVKDEIEAISLARKAELISDKDASLLRDAAAAVEKAIAVDAFKPGDIQKTSE